jgi:hypothetical protein
MRKSITIAMMILMIFLLAISFPVFFMSSGKDTPCEQLPAIMIVQEAFRDHEDVVDEITGMHPGHIWISIGTDRCPGKGEILIYYDTEANHRKIVELLGDSFFGVPYRMFNT